VSEAPSDIFMNHSSDLSRDTFSANSIRSSGPTVINASTGIPPSPRTRRRSTSFSSSSTSSIRYPSICRIALRLCRRPVGLGALVTMFKSAAENVKAFVATRPPLVLFLIFLTSCAATLLFMTVYLRNNQIRDPTEENDWNLFLENFAKIDFCVESRRNGTLFPSFNVSVDPNEEALQKAVANVKNHFAAGNKTFSINVLLVIHPTLEFLARSDNLTHLSGSVSGIHLGLTGDLAAQSVLDVSFELGRNRSLKESMCTKNNLFVGHRCPDVVMPTCAHVSGPASLFPVTALAPSKCVAASPSSTRGADGSPVETHARITAHHELASSGWGAAPYCPRGPIAHTKFKLDPALTVFLGVDDRSVINLHLLHTSFFLVVMVFSVLCVAACKNHSHANIRACTNLQASTSGTAVNADQRGKYALVA